MSLRERARGRAVTFVSWILEIGDSHHARLGLRVAGSGDDASTTQHLLAGAAGDRPERVGRRRRVQSNRPVDARCAVRFPSRSGARNSILLQRPPTFRRMMVLCNQDGMPCAG